MRNFIARRTIPIAAALLALAAVSTANAAELECRPGMPCYQPPAARRTPAAAAPPSVVRIKNDLRGECSLGSGTLVEKDERYGWIITCAHLFADGVGRVSAYFPRAHHRYYAKVFAIDQRADLALLVICAPEAPASPVATERAAPGEPLVFHGFGQGDYRAARGVARRQVSLDGGRTWQALEWSGAARQGDSGGPALNAQGQLAAVIAGSDGRVTLGSDCLRVEAFLQQHRQRLKTPSPQTQRPEPSLVQTPQSAPTAGDAALRRELAALRDNYQSLDRRFEQLQWPDGCTCQAPCEPDQIVAAVLAQLPREQDAEWKTFTVRLAALEAAFEGQTRYRLRRVPVE